jgi:hypothetical protein
VVIVVICCDGWLLWLMLQYTRLLYINTSIVQQFICECVCDACVRYVRTVEWSSLLVSSSKLHYMQQFWLSRDISTARIIVLNKIPIDALCVG